jgi:mobilome CxxCx(11)CxxC protein
MRCPYHEGSSGRSVIDLIGFTATAEWLEAAATTRNLILGALGAAAVAQLLFALWSMIAHWDDDLAYCSRDGESYDLKEAWKRIGEDDVADLKQEYGIRQIQQANIASHDVQKDISSKEKQIGMRAGLLEFQRKCVCGLEPKSRNVPWWPRHARIHCGGN